MRRCPFGALPAPSMRRRTWRIEWTYNMDSSNAAEALGFDGLGLSDEVLAAVRDLGYTEPTPVQAAAIPEVLAGRDLLAAAQTGTGKTAAFLLPTMCRLGHVAPRGERRRRARGRGPLMLVVTPTRELAQQIEDVCARVAEHTGHIAVTVVGGVGYNPQRSALKNGCDILVATPGRLVDLIGEGSCSLSEVQVLVLDEADRMLDMGFLPDMRKIVGATPDDRQTLLFSATLDEKAVGAVTDLVRDPARVEIAPPRSTADTVDQYVLPVSSEAKNALLANVLKREGPERVIVFMRTKHRADGCCRRLARAGIKAAPIHGNRTQAQRERALKAFRDGEVDVLVATDVLARGIDITDVRYVVNFDVPSEPTDYIHRIGRTGRAGEVGWALTFVTELDVEEFFDIEALMGKTADLFDADGLELGAHPPIIDPGRVPASRAKKKTKRGKSTSKKKRSSTGPHVSARRGAHCRTAPDSSDASGEGVQRDGSRSKVAASAAGADEKAPRPARPKRSGRARVRSNEADSERREHDEKLVHDEPRSARANRSGRRARTNRQGSADAGEAVTRKGRGSRGRGAQRGASSRDALSHDWRNSDFPDERRGRGGRGGHAAGTVSRSGRMGKPAGHSRRPGDFGGRRK